MEIPTDVHGRAWFRGRTAASHVCLGSAALGCVLLFAIALNLTHFHRFALHRFRETTWFVHGMLLFAYVLNPSTASRASWRSHLRSVIDQPRFLAAAGLCMLFLYVATAVTQHLSFNTYSHDLSMIDQALEQTLAGHFMFSPVLQRSFFSEHWSPILLVLVPLHALFRSPWLLVFVQPVALWLSGLVLARLIDSGGHPRALRNVAVLCFWNHPFMISTLPCLFHMECFLPLLALLATLYAARRQALSFALVILALLAIKEDVGLYVFGFGAWLVLSRRHRLWGLLTCVGSAAWVIAAFKVWIPAFQTQPAEYPFLGRWSAWGTTPIEILGGFVRQPVHLLQMLVHDPMPRVFACFAFLPFLGGRGVVLIVVPWILNATSGFVQQASMSLYYGAPLLAFGAIAAVEGLQSKSWQRIARSRFILAVAFIVLALNVAHFVLPWIPRDRAKVLATIKSIPKDDTIEAMPCFVPVLSYDALATVLLPASRPVSGHETAAAEPTATWLLLRTARTTWPWSASQLDDLRHTAQECGYESAYESPGFVILRATRTP